MEIHHGKHHQTYVNNLNAALESHTALSGKPVDELIADLSQVPEEIRAAVRNNGGGPQPHFFSGSNFSFRRWNTDWFPQRCDYFSFLALLILSRTLCQSSPHTLWLWLGLADQNWRFCQGNLPPNQDSPLMEGVADDSEHLQSGWMFGNMLTTSTIRIADLIMLVHFGM